RWNSQRTVGIAKNTHENISGNQLKKNPAVGSACRWIRCKKAGPMLSDATRLKPAKPATSALAPALLPVSGNGSSRRSQQLVYEGASLESRALPSALGSTWSNT